MNDQNQVPPEEYNKPLGGKGGDLPPLPLLPDREWLGARVVNVELRFQMFNNQIQYICRQEFDESAGKEVDVPVLDDDGNKIPRKEFNIKFQLHDYSIPGAKTPTQRNVWLSIGASMSDRSHLPQFLMNVLGADFQAETPQDIVDALSGCEVKLQLANRPNKKDTTKPPYQNVIYDAVVALEKPEGTAPPAPMNEAEVEDPAPDSKHCACPSGTKADAENVCTACGKLQVAWDE